MTILGDFRILALAAIAAALTALPAQAEDKYALKAAAAEPPQELKSPIRQLLEPRALQVFGPGGELYCEVWFRKAIPAKATEEQIKNGLTYRELEQTTLLGAIRYATAAKDYRNQDVKPGVYTLRLAYQPQDGDHMGTAPHTEFCLLVQADKDEKPDPFEPKMLHELSAKTLEGNHPGVLLLFPNNKPDAEPALADKGMGHWALVQELRMDVEGKPARMGIGLNVIGHSPAS